MDHPFQFYSYPYNDKLAIAFLSSSPSVIVKYTNGRSESVRGELFSDGVYSYTIAVNVLSHDLNTISVPSDFFDTAGKKTVARQNVKIGKVVPKGGDVASGILDNSVTTMEHFPAGIFNPNAIDKDVLVPGVPINPSWEIGQSQAEAQKPGTIVIPKPVPPPDPTMPPIADTVNLTVKVGFTDGLYQTSISVPVPVGVAIGQDVLDGIADKVAGVIGLSVADILTGWEVAGVRVAADTIALADWQAITAVVSVPKPATLPDTSVKDPSFDLMLLDLKKFFPFCIPFDIYDFFNILAAEPVTPVFSWDMPLPTGGSYHWEIDLTDFNGVASVCRKLMGLLFAVGLAVKTRDLIKG